MDIILWPPKDSSESLIYGLDWTEALAGDPVISAAWTVPAGLTTSNEVTAGYSTALTIAGGDSGKLYTLVCTVETADQTINQTVQLQIN